MHFIRGYFDGDGCIRIFRDKSHPKPYKKEEDYPLRCKLQFLGTKEFLMSIRDILGINKNIIKTQNIYRMDIASKADLDQVLNECLYKNATIYLDRKYKKYCEYKKLYSAL